MVLVVNPYERDVASITIYHTSSCEIFLCPSHYSYMHCLENFSCKLNTQLSEQVYISENIANFIGVARLIDSLLLTLQRRAMEFWRELSRSGTAYNKWDLSCIISMDDEHSWICISRDEDTSFLPERHKNDWLQKRWASLNLSAPGNGRRT